MSNNLMISIKDAYLRVQDNIVQAAHTCGRDPDEIKLVVVSKSQPVEKIQAAIDVGIRLFGENYPEEARQKIQKLRPPVDVHWHMIGHLQSRKIKICVEQFQMIQSVDSLRLAIKLDNYLSALKAEPYPILLEMNVSGEESKFGFPGWDDASLDKALFEIEALLNLEHLKVQGVMAIPPLFDNPELSRPFHRRLYNIREQFMLKFPQQDWRDISSGTSYDYKVAIQEGATYVRVGQAIMGARVK